MASVIIALAPQLAQLAASIIARHQQGLPPKTGVELAAELQDLQGQWEKNKTDAEALLKEGHE